MSLFCDSGRIGASLLAYQGGREEGRRHGGAADGHGLSLRQAPSTLARDLSDYPSTAHFHDSPHYVEYTEDIYVGHRYFETLPGMAGRVCYPFGHGLSYTTFALETIHAKVEDGRIQVEV